MLIMYLVTIIIVIITLLILEDDCGCEQVNNAKIFTIDHPTPRSFSFGMAGTVLISHEGAGVNIEGAESKASTGHKTYELFNPESVCQDKFIMRDKNQMFMG